jgi:hypothetical protein
MAKRTQALPSILDKNFVYRVAAKTNVAETFKRFGWVPPSEKLNKQQERK